MQLVIEKFYFTSLKKEKKKRGGRGGERIIQEENTTQYEKPTWGQGRGSRVGGWGGRLGMKICMTPCPLAGKKKERKKVILQQV